MDVQAMKRAPSVCPVTRDSINDARYKILLSVSPMTTVTQTTHGAETRRVNEPFAASVNSTTTIHSSDGNATAYGTASVSGTQTRTVIVPTETTTSQSSIRLYMFTYRANGDNLALLATDSVLFQWTATTGSSRNCNDGSGKPLSRGGEQRQSRCVAVQQLGSLVGDAVRNSRYAHLPERLYKEAVEAIVADQVGSPSKAPDGRDQAARIATTSAPMNTGVAKCTFTSIPENAEISIDGTFSGSAPSTLSLPAGKHRIAVSAAGYQPWSREMNVAAGSEISIHAVLEKVTD